MESTQKGCDSVLIRARSKQTIVYYMGLHGLDMFCTKLVEHNLSGGMPIAIVQQGTTQNQRVIADTLATPPGVAQIEKLKPPPLIIAGGIVTLREKLAWFDAQKSIAAVG